MSIPNKGNIHPINSAIAAPQPEFQVPMFNGWLRDWIRSFIPTGLSRNIGKRLFFPLLPDNLPPNRGSRAGRTIPTRRRIRPGSTNGSSVGFRAGERRH